VASKDIAPKPQLPANVYLSPLLWLMALLLLVYVGIEFGLGSWISAYTSTSLGLTAQYGAWVTSIYWAALAVGRLAGAAAASRLPRLRLMTLAVLGSLLGGFALLFSRGLLPATVLSLAWIAFSYGTVYPTTIALGTTAFPGNKGKAIGAIIAMGSVGGIILPWLAGVLLAGSTTLPYLWFVVASLLGLLLLVFGIRRFVTRDSIPA
jgi:fucose permease